MTEALLWVLAGLLILVGGISLAAFACWSVQFWLEELRD